MKRRGFTLIELLVVVAIIALLIAILLPSLGKARELSNRSVCLANLRGIGQSLNVYAAGNDEAFPVIFKSGTAVLTSAGAGQTSSDATITNIYSSASATNGAMQNLWILVLNGQVAPKQFLCKSDPNASTVAAQSSGGTYKVYFNDNGGGNSNNAFSYSFAFPWTATTPTIGGWWRNTTDASLALMADMAPNGGTAPNNTTTTTPAVRTANSFTHQRDGQSVGYADAHAEFARRPDVGQSSDNIYTSNTGTPSSTGTAYAGGASAPGIGTGGSPGAYDVCFVPVAVGGTTRQ